MACDKSCLNPMHLEKETHVNNAWTWCFGDEAHNWPAQAPNLEWPLGVIRISRGQTSGPRPR